MRPCSGWASRSGRVEPVGPVGPPYVDPLLPAHAVERLAAGLGTPGIGAVVADLVGAGMGLTPSGDDLLAGALAALRAVGSPAADALGAAVAARTATGTSRLSAALLAAADSAAVIPEAEAVLRAMVVRPGRRLGAAVGPLLGVGHTSGWHLAAGLAVGAAHAVGAAARSGVPTTGTVDAAASLGVAPAGVVGVGR